MNETMEQTAYAQKEKSRTDQKCPGIPFQLQRRSHRPGNRKRPPGYTETEERNEKLLPDMIRDEKILIDLIRSPVHESVFTLFLLIKRLFK
jgi:hypothetical protein